MKPDLDRGATAVHEKESIAGLIRELRDETATLFRQEVELAKRETSEKVSRASRNAAYMATGGAVLFAGFLVLLWSATFAVAIGLSAAGLESEIVSWLAPLIVGLVVAMIGLSLVAKGKRTLREMSARPDRTVESLKENKQWFQNKMKRE